MRNLNNDYQYVIFIIAIITLNLQLISCTSVVPNKVSNNNESLSMETKLESKQRYSINQEGNKVSRIAVGPGKNKLYIVNRNDMYSLTDVNGKDIKGCIYCTEEFLEKHGPNENCESLKEKIGIVICEKDPGPHFCPPNECEKRSGYARICVPCGVLQ